MHPTQHELCAQAPAQERLSHELLRKHTEHNPLQSGTAALVEQIQALTATHQELAKQIQALVKVVIDQQSAARPVDSAASPFLVAVAVVLCVTVGLVIARFV